MRNSGRACILDRKTGRHVYDLEVTLNTSMTAYLATPDVEISIAASNDSVYLTDEAID
jgi:hypothetical protein